MAFGGKGAWGVLLGQGGGRGLGRYTHILLRMAQNCVLVGGTQK